MNFLNNFKKPQQQEEDFDLLPDGVFTLESDGKIINVNSKALMMLNMKKFDVVGRYFSDFFENGTSLLNKIVREGNPQCARTIPGNKKEYVQSIELSATRNLEREKVYVSARNATLIKKEQKSISEKYEVAQKIIDEKNDFLIDSSGSILSNLVSISGFSRALLDGMGGALSEKQEKYLKIINTNARDLNYDLEKLFSLFKLESHKVEYTNKAFDMVSMLKSIERVYKKDFEDKKVIFSLDYSTLAQRDCFLDSEVVEYILRCIMDIFLRFSYLGKCTLNVGHPPVDFLKTREFDANDSLESEKYILFEAKITDLTFSEEELEDIFNPYNKTNTKRPIGLRATLSILKRYIKDFRGDIWVYSKQNFGTMFTFVLPLR